MKGSAGCPAGIVTPVPHMRELARGETNAGAPDAPLTCRHFGIHRSYFYRRKKRSDPKRLSSLENKPSVPKRKREPGYSRELVRAVRAVREADLSYSAKKIRPILLRERDRASVPSVSTLGRLIARENLFFRPGTKRHKKRSKAAETVHERKSRTAQAKAFAHMC